MIGRGAVPNSALPPTGGAVPVSPRTGEGINFSKGKVEKRVIPRLFNLKKCFVQGCNRVQKNGAIMLLITVDLRKIFRVYDESNSGFVISRSGVQIPSPALCFQSLSVAPSFIFPLFWVQIRAKLLRVIWRLSTACDPLTSLHRNVKLVVANFAGRFRCVKSAYRSEVPAHTERIVP